MPGPYDGKYVTNADMRSEGIDTSIATDSACEIAIRAAEAYIESRCNRWFYQLAATLTLDGGDHYFPFFGFVETTDLLMLPIPVISLSAVTIDGVAQSISSFIPFSRIGPPRDDRWNPRIISKNHIWPKQGVQNIGLTGNFGFVESDLTPPALIKIAARKLAIDFLPQFKMTDSERDAIKFEDYISSEQLPGGGYKYNYGKQWDKLCREYTGDHEIDETIEYYRYKKFVVAV